MLDFCKSRIVAQFLIIDQPRSIDIFHQPIILTISYITSRAKTRYHGYQIKYAVKYQITVSVAIGLLLCEKIIDKVN